MPKLQALPKLALITGARIGELLALRWDDCQDRYLTFWDTENGKVRRIPVTETIAALLASRPRIHAWVFTNAKTEMPYTTIRKLFDARTGQDHNRRRDGPHAAPHRAVTHDRARPRRLHGNVDLRPLVHADARAIYASDTRTLDRRARDVQSVHKMSTRLRTAKRGSRSCLFC